MNAILQADTSSHFAVTTGTGDTSFSLINLNDDCLMEVFDYLNYSDQINITKVCRTFKACCKAIIKRKGIHLTGESTNAKIVLKTFGAEAKKVVIDMKLFPDMFTSGTVLSKINEHCPIVETIELIDLKLFECPLNDGWFDGDCEHECDESWTQCPPNAKKVIINGDSLCDGTPLFHFWSKCAESLTINNLRMHDDIFECIHNLFEVKDIESKRDGPKTKRKRPNISIIKASFIGKKVEGGK